LSEASSLKILSFTVDSSELFTSSLSSTLSVWCSRNLRVHLSTGCPHYTGSGTNMKKLSRLPTWTAVNVNGKGGSIAVTDTREPNSLADTAEPRREYDHRVPTGSTSPQNCSPPLASDLRGDEAATVHHGILIEASAQHLSTLASETNPPPQ